jgi:hypothetical protein
MADSFLSRLAGTMKSYFKVGNHRLNSGSPHLEVQTSSGSLTSLKATAIQLTTGAAAGKVLTSDASGNASWETPTGGIGGATDLDSLSDVSISSPANGQQLVFNGTSWVNSATSNPYKVFDPDYPPASAGADDDEFNDASISGSWSVFDPNSRLVRSEGNMGLEMYVNAVGGDENIGLYKAAPGSGAWTIWSKISISAGLTSFPAGGLFVFQSTPSSSQKFVRLGLNSVNDGSVSLHFQQWTNYTTFSATVRAITINTTSLYLCLSYNPTGSVMSAYYSVDGRSWRLIGTSTYLATQPSHYGIYANKSTTGTGSDSVTRAQFFRQVAALMTPNTVLNGRYLS